MRVDIERRVQVLVHAQPRAVHSRRL